MRPSDIAKALKIGRASVYRVQGQKAGNRGPAVSSGTPDESHVRTQLQIVWREFCLLSVPHGCGKHSAIHPLIRGSL
jgi:hypothetical protein